MAEWNRIVAECDGYPILIEGFVEDTRMLRKGMVYMGFQGTVEESRPFILHPNGQVDFGYNFEEYQLADSTILEKQMRVGEVFTIIEYDDDSEEWEKNTYKITKVDKV